MNKNSKILNAIMIVILSLSLMSCSNDNIESIKKLPESNPTYEVIGNTPTPGEIDTKEVQEENYTSVMSESESESNVYDALAPNSENSIKYGGKSYIIIEVEGDDLSGD